MPDSLPDAETLFPADASTGGQQGALPDVETLFSPAVEQENAQRRQRVINTGNPNPSPLQDFLFSNEGPVGTAYHSAGRVLDAFGHGFDEAFPKKPAGGYVPAGIPQEEYEKLKDWVGFKDWSESSQRLAMAENRVLLRPAAYALVTGQRTAMGAFAGAQAAVAQLGEEVGQPKLGRELAAVPEAFMGSPHVAGIPSAQFAELERARQLKVIGPDGEAGWKGWTPPAREGVATPVREEAEPAAAPPPAAEAVPAPTGEPASPAPRAAAPQPPADIHAAARQVDPETFRDYDALTQRRDTFQRWIGELRESRDQRAAEEAPHADEIANLQDRIANPDTTNRLRKKYEARLVPLVEENEAWTTERAASDSRDMANIRKRLQDVDYQMRDMAPKVSAAYRTADERFPELRPKEEPRPAEPGPAAAEAPAREEASPQPAPTTAERPAAPERLTTQAVQEELPGVRAEAPAIRLKPGKATWANKDVDLPVEIADEAPSIGPDGRSYQKVKYEGKDSYVPLDEIKGAEKAAPAPPARTIEEQREFIRNDVARQLQRAGRPSGEAEAAGALIAARYETRAAQFKGVRGTAEELYREEGAEILGPGMKPGQPVVRPPSQPRVVNEEKLSLVPFLAHRGGISPADPLASDLRAILGDNPKTWRGPVFQEGGMTLDRAREAAAEAGYIEHEGRGGTENRGGGTSTVKTLLDAINDESRGRKRYRQGYEPPVEALDADHEEYLREQELLQPSSDAFSEGKNTISYALGNIFSGRVSSAAIQVPEGGGGIRVEWNAAKRELNIDNIDFERKGTGAFSAYLDHIEQLAQEHGIRRIGVESILNDRLIPFLQARGYTIERPASGHPNAFKDVPAEGKELLQRQRPTEPSAIHEIPGFHFGPNFLSPNELYQIKAYHGSPHDFDRFDLSKIGTGEARLDPNLPVSQRQVGAYGPGLYFAENEGVAASYEQQLRPVTAAMSTARDGDKFSVYVAGKKVATFDTQAEASAHRDMLWEQQEKAAPPGHVYQVSIKAEPEHFLDWDKPLSEQSEHVRKTLGVDKLPQKPTPEEWRAASDLAEQRRVPLRDLPEYQELDRRLAATTSRQTWADALGISRTHIPAQPEKLTGSDFLQILQQDMGGEGATNKLHSAGIAGIKYLDQGSRAQITDDLALVNQHIESAKLRLDSAQQTGKQDYIDRMQGELDHWIKNKGLLEGSVAQTRNYVVFDDKLIDITHKDGTPVIGKDRDDIVKELLQPARGKINLNPQGTPGRNFLGVEGVRPVMNLMKDANASTFIHESGHQFLGELLRDAEHEAAPAQLKADAQTTLKWLGIEKTEDLKTSHHEKFAIGFEQYLREGTAPSPGLARVFVQFKQWLTKLYETIKGLGKPINEDIRGVFDRLLAEEPQRTVIAPEREVAKNFADIHEADAEATLPEYAEPAALNVDRERDSLAAEKLVEEDQHARLESVTEKDRRLAPGSEKPPGDGNEAGAAGREGGASSPPGEVGPGLSEAVAEGAGAPAQPRKAARPVSEPPANVHEPFKPVERLIDKAGNFRLENISDSEDIRQAIRESVERNNAFVDERRGVLGDAEALDLAEAMGLKPSDLNRRAIGEAWNKEQIIALEKLLIQSAARVSDAAKRAAEAGTEEAFLAYGEEEARQQMIMDQVAAHASGVRAEAGRALQAYAALKKMTGSMEAHAVADVLKKSTGQDLFQLQQRARAIANLQTPAQVAGAIIELNKRGLGAMALEIFKNWLISGPITHTTYHIGSQMLALYKAVPETAMQALASQVRETITGETGTRIYYGEVGAQLYAMFFGQRDGWRAAYDSFKTGQTMTLPFEELDKMTVAERAKYDTLISHGAGTVTHEQAIERLGIGGATTPFTNTQAVPGIAGTIVRIPGERMVAPLHSFGRTVGYIQSIARQAYRQAANEGLTGNAFATRMADLKTRPTEEMMTLARNDATGQMLMAHGGEFTKRVSAFVNWEANLPRPIGPTKPLGFIDPFVHISSNIMKQAVIERSPIGLLSPQLRADMTGKNGRLAQDTAVGRMVAGTSLSIVGGGLAMEGLITPSAPSDRHEAAMTEMVNGTPHSLRIGDLSIELNRLGVLGLQMGIAADLYHVADRIGKDEATEIASLLVHSFAHNFMDEGFAKGPSDMMKALDDPDRYGATWIRNFVSSFAVPYSVGAGQIARRIDPYSRQARTLIDAMKAKVPWLSETLMPRRDIWGEPVLNREYWGVYVERLKNDPVNRTLKEIGMFPSPVKRDIRGVDLTDEQHDQYAMLAGRQAKLMVSAAVLSPGFAGLPAGQQVMLVERAITKARGMAANHVMMTWPDIYRQATQEKIENITGSPATVH
jgi:hypothetical protein